MLFVQICVLMYCSTRMCRSQTVITGYSASQTCPYDHKRWGTFFCIPFPSKNNTPVRGKVQFPPSLATWCFVRSRVERSGVPALEQPEFWRWKKWTLGLEKFVVESSVFLEVFSKLLTFQSTGMSIQSYYNHSTNGSKYINIVASYVEGFRYQGSWFILTMLLGIVRMFRVPTWFLLANLLGFSSENLIMEVGDNATHYSYMVIFSALDIWYLYINMHQIYPVWNVELPI